MKKVTGEVKTNGNAFTQIMRLPSDFSEENISLTAKVFDVAGLPILESSTISLSAIEDVILPPVVVTPQDGLSYSGLLRILWNVPNSYVKNSVDEYGYHAKVKSFTNYEDIRSVGTRLSISDSDDASESVNLPFPFPFYGTPLNSLYVGTNGTLSTSSFHIITATILISQVPTYRVI